MKIVKIKSLLFIVMLAMCTLMYPQGDEGPGEPPGCDDPAGCEDQAPENPIDGGLSLLIVAGTAYGIYESRKRK